MGDNLFSRAHAATGTAIHVRMLDAETAIGRMIAGDVVIVDVREPDERERARIPGSISMPLSVFDPAEVPNEAGKEVLFHCASGVRCGIAAQRMRWAGFTGPINRLNGGLAAWIEAGGPIDRD